MEIQFCLLQCLFRSDYWAPFIDNSYSKFRNFTLNSWSTNIWNGGTPPLIKVTKVVSTSNFKNDSAGIKYVEYNGTVL